MSQTTAVDQQRRLAQEIVAEIENSLETLEFETEIRDMGWQYDVRNIYTQDYITHTCTLPDGGKVSISFEAAVKVEETGEVRPGFDKETLSFGYQSADGSKEMYIVGFEIDGLDPNTVEGRINTIYQKLQADQQEEDSLEDLTHP